MDYSSSPLELQYRDIFLRAPVGMCVSQDRVIQIANTTLETMFGFEAGALAQASFERLYPTSREFERTGLRLAPTLWTGESYSDERIMRRLSGDLFWCHVVGRALSPPTTSSAVIWVFEDLSAKRPVASELNARDREIAVLIADGHTSKEIARKLSLSPRTVEKYRAGLMKKFGATTSSSLIHKLMGSSGL